MTTKLVKWDSEHGQMAKIRPSVACGGRNTTTAAQFEYDRHGFEGYLGNVGLSVNKVHILSDNGHSRTGHDKDLLSEVLCFVC